MPTIYQSAMIGQMLVLVPTATEGGQTKTKINSDTQEFLESKGALLSAPKNGPRGFYMQNTPENQALAKAFDDAGESYMQKVLGLDKTTTVVKKNPLEILQARIERALLTSKKAIAAQVSGDERAKVWGEYAQENQIPAEVVENLLNIHYRRPLETFVTSGAVLSEEEADADAD